MEGLGSVQDRSSTCLGARLVWDLQSHGSMDLQHHRQSSIVLAPRRKPPQTGSTEKHSHVANATNPSLNNVPNIAIGTIVA